MRVGAEGPGFNPQSGYEKIFQHFIVSDWVYECLKSGWIQR